MNGLGKIKNRNNFILKSVPQYHPESIKYLQWWREQKKRIIEGFWSVDDAKYDIDVFEINPKFPEKNDKWRWMPPQLYFYINFGTILHNPEGTSKTAPKKRMHPYLRDVEWNFFYNWMEARGFSGFEGDEEYSCNRALKDYKDYKDLKYLPKSCLSKKHKVKKYIPAREYLRRLWDKPMGAPLYENEALSLFVLGSRAFGKSFSVSIGIVLHEILTDGAKRYNQDAIEHPATVDVFVGAALSSKSSDLLTKLKIAYDELPGKWAEGTDEEYPSPLYKEMSGSLSPNNIKNPWRNEYEKKVGGRWSRVGSRSSLKHGIWSVENPESAVGGRYTVLVAEEVGLIPNLLTVHGANEACLVEGANRFGSSVYIGTAGSMEKILEPEVIFRDPGSFNFLEFEDEWEGSGKIGWFVPAYYAFNQFKDDNGNTNVEEALAYIEERREKKRKAKTSSAITLELLSFPIKPSEMFLRASGNFFPVDDLKNRLAELEANEKLLNASWKAKYVITENGEVEYRSSQLPVIKNFPLKRGDNMEGCIEIFEMPKKNALGQVTAGRYIAGMDPIDDDDNQDIALSLQSAFILDTFTDRIVAEYSSRTRLAETFYENFRRMLIAYNAKVNYEQNKKGLYAYFKNKNSLYLLAETPQILRDQDLTRISSVGNKSFGTNANERINEWARQLILSWLSAQAIGKEDGVTNLQTIRSVGLLKELISWSKDINADRVSALGMLMIYREEVVSRVGKEDDLIPKDTFDLFWDNIYKGKRRRLVNHRKIKYHV